MIADRPPRRIVTVDDAQGRSKALVDAPVADLLHDPARPGYRSARVWSTDRTPAALLSMAEVDRLPGLLVPPRGGSLFRILTVPPTASAGKADRIAARDFFDAAHAPHLWCGDDAPDAYMQQGHMLDLCVVLEGEVVLVLDTAEVVLRAGDTVVQQAARHAWKNRTRRPAVLAISSHDAAQA